MINKIKDNPLETSLINDTTTKTDERIHFFAMTDYLSSVIMELSSFLNDDTLKEKLYTIVKNLSKIMGFVAGSKGKLEEKEIDELLKDISFYKKSPQVLNSFVLPGKNITSAKIHVVRTITRLCELEYAKVYEKYSGNKYVFEYLNKLSTFFYELALNYE